VERHRRPILEVLKAKLDDFLVPVFLFDRHLDAHADLDAGHPIEGVEHRRARVAVGERVGAAVGRRLGDATAPAVQVRWGRSIGGTAPAGRGNPEERPRHGDQGSEAAARGAHRGRR